MEGQFYVIRNRRGNKELKLANSYHKALKQHLDNYDRHPELPLDILDQDIAKSENMLRTLEALPDDTTFSYEEYDTNAVTDEELAASTREVTLTKQGEIDSLKTILDAAKKFRTDRERPTFFQGRDNATTPRLGGRKRRSTRRRKHRKSRKSRRHKRRSRKY